MHRPSHLHPTTGRNSIPVHQAIAKSIIQLNRTSTLISLIDPLVPMRILVSKIYESKFRYNIPPFVTFHLLHHIRSQSTLDVPKQNKKEPSTHLLFMSITSLYPISLNSFPDSIVSLYL